MSTQPLNPYTPAQRAATPARLRAMRQALADALGDAWQRFSQARRIRRDTRTLQALDDAQLKDMGLQRHQIESAVEALSRQRGHLRRGA